MVNRKAVVVVLDEGVVDRNGDEEEEAGVHEADEGDIKYTQTIFHTIFFLSSIEKWSGQLLP